METGHPEAGAAAEVVEAAATATELIELKDMRIAQLRRMAAVVP
jgi:hypothetical protein